MTEPPRVTRTVLLLTEATLARPALTAEVWSRFMLAMFTIALPLVVCASSEVMSAAAVAYVIVRFDTLPGATAATAASWSVDMPLALTVTVEPATTRA